MEDWVFLIVMLFIWGFLVTNQFLSVFRAKEIRDKRAVDLHLLALENETEFSANGQELNQLLYKHSLHANVHNGKSKNVIIDAGAETTTYIFDYVGNSSILNTYGKTEKSLETVNGFIIYFKNKTFPNFDIAKSQNRVLSGYVRTNPSLNPQWMPHIISAYTERHDSEEIIKLIHQNQVLENLFKEPTFSTIKFRGQYVGVYFSDLLPSTLRFYERLKNRAMWVLELTDSRVIAQLDPVQEIKLLKNN